MTGPFESAEDGAAYWVARMDAGDWSAADEKALVDWLGQDAARHGLLLRTHAAWLAADVARVAPDREVDTGAAAAEAAPFWRRRKVLGGLAAAVVAGVAGVAGKRKLFDAETSYATNLGEIRRVPLADGSVMTINSASALLVRMDDHSRRIELARGEAWFEVAKDAERPFVVTAAGVKAQAVGTAFSMRVRDDGVEILVTEGIVETRHENDVGDVEGPRLVAGQRAFVGEHAGFRYQPEQASSVDRSLAWRGGMIDLEGETLADAAGEFNRYNRRKIVVADPSLAGEKLDGVFRVNDPEGFALAVQVSLKATVVINDPEVIRIER